MKWKISGNCAWQVIDDEAVIINLDTGKSVGLNPTGSFIWERLNSEDDAMIAHDLAASTGVPLEQVQKDVDDFIRELKERDLIAPA